VVVHPPPGCQVPNGDDDDDDDEDEGDGTALRILHARRASSCSGHVVFDIGSGPMACRSGDDDADDQHDSCSTTTTQTSSFG